MLRDILERAHCCDELLAFAAKLDAEGAMAYSRWRGLEFEDLWSNIDRHDWLTWLMRHCPDQFEDSWRDATSALHAMADAFSGLSAQQCPEVRADLACDLIRSYVRLRAVR